MSKADLKKIVHKLLVHPINQEVYRDESASAKSYHI